MNTNLDAPRASFHGFEQIPLHEYAERAYLDYSMYVILDRALPFIGDGLKPVQRRIIYAMSELGLAAGSKPKKAARTIGDVIGKFHPHGDQACYDAMVLMAQPFAFRYPLVDGHGNFGSADDPKSFAAMRYTEARLAPLAQALLAEIDQGTVDFTPNFDGTLEEPSWLPARLPNLLLNGTTGIAVGMATDVPPHNLREVVAALIELIDDPTADLAALTAHIPGPDYPTAAEIVTTPAELSAIYASGGGSLRARAIFEREGTNIVITALPHQASPAKVLEQIAAQMRAKKLPWLEDLRDESDHRQPVRLVLMPRSNRVDVEQLMGHLFATTDLEKSYRVNLNIIGLDGRPQVKDLRQILVEWLDFRRTTVKRRLTHRLEKVDRRLHLLEGLLIAYLDIDEVIRIIRSEDEPKAALIARFELSLEQTDYILETRLRQLARLEEMKIRGELAELAAERKTIRLALSSRAKLIAVVRSELLEDAEKYGDERRSPIVVRAAAAALAEADLVSAEPVTVVLSEKGWVRAAKGHEIDPASLTFREGDKLLHAARGRSTQQVAFLDSTGRSYSTPAHTLPSARSQGEPLTGRFTIGADATVSGLAIADDEQRFIVASDRGYGFVTQFANFVSRQKAGKQLLNVPAGAALLLPAPVFDVETDLAVAVTSAGHLLAFPLADLPELDRGRGNKLMQIPPAKLKSGAEYCVAIAAVPTDGELVLYCGQRKLVLRAADIEAYQGNRAQRGRLLPRGFQRVDSMVAHPRA